MKVKELITELLEYNMDADVTTPYSETIELGYISGADATDEFDRKSTPLVFINGCDWEQDIE